MILLFGGTSDTAGAAESLADAGYQVLVSTATEMPLEIGERSGILRRHGRMNGEQAKELLLAENIRAVVDASHPYATALHTTAACAAADVGIPYLRLERASTLGAVEVTIAKDHEEAARMAFSFGLPVLLTTGSRNLAPYSQQSKLSGIPLFARVLDHPESHQACSAAGLKPEQVIAGRGPFSIKDNRVLIQRFGIGVLVTKDSGQAGGVEEKMESARLENCQVVVVGRPAETPIGYASMEALISALDAKLAPLTPVLALDLESVLLPEIWHAVAATTGIAELAITTREIPDYHALMNQRIALCRLHGLSLSKLQMIASALEPLDGALEFLKEAHRHAEVVVISDTFIQIAAPLLAKLGSPLFLCNQLEVNEAGILTGWTPRLGGKQGAVEALRRRGRRVIAAGDSFNDLPMLAAANVGILFCPCPKIKEAYPEYFSVGNYTDLLTACFGNEKQANLGETKL